MNEQPFSVISGSKKEPRLPAPAGEEDPAEIKRQLRTGLRMELSELDQTRPEGQYTDDELDTIAEALLDSEKLPDALKRFPELRRLINLEE